MNAVESGQQDETENEETAQAPEVEPPPLADDYEDEESHWAEGMEAHIKDKQNEEDNKTRDKSKRARKKCRQKERKRMIKMGCGCS